MIIRCDNCSVSLQLDESKVPGKNFAVRCPRCQNLVRVNGNNNSTVQQLQQNSPAPAIEDGAEDFSKRESDMQVNNALKSLMGALNGDNKTAEFSDVDQIKPRRVLLCLGRTKDAVSKTLSDAGYKVYIASNPAQANERLKEGKTEILLFAADFAEELGGAAILQQKINSMSAAERRRLYLVSVEEKSETLNAHDAFLRNLNLIVNIKDVAQMPLLLNRSLEDFNDLYFYYNRATGMQPI